MLYKFTAALEADHALSDAAKQLRSAGFRKQATAIEDIRHSLACETERKQTVVYAMLRGVHPANRIRQ